MFEKIQRKTLGLEHLFIQLQVYSTRTFNFAIFLRSLSFSEHVEATASVSMKKFSAAPLNHEKCLRTE